jgi:hypothetical protein
MPATQIGKIRRKPKAGFTLFCAFQRGNAGF